jgi:hypothetical protein
VPSAVSADRAGVEKRPAAEVNESMAEINKR